MNNPTLFHCLRQPGTVLTLHPAMKVRILAFGKQPHLVGVLLVAAGLRCSGIPLQTTGAVAVIARILGTVAQIRTGSAPSAPASDSKGLHVCLLFV
jgi:hypothetical protein